MYEEIGVIFVVLVWIVVLVLIVLDFKVIGDKYMVLNVEVL